jgi:hypothetical protein
VLFSNDLIKLIFGPILHSLLLHVSHVHVNGSLLRFTLDGKVMRELAFVALGTGAGLKEGTKDGFWIGACNQK